MTCDSDNEKTGRDNQQSQINFANFAFVIFEIFFADSSGPSFSPNW